MPHETQSCQLPHANRGDSRGNSTSAHGIPCHPTLLPDHLHEVDTTPSRHSGPRKWLISVEWLIAHRVHPKANSTTLAVARDLHERMDYSTGHALYCMTEIAARLDVDKSTVKRHVAILRQLGALAWFEHGTKANLRSRMGLGGYAGTATIYAATIPAMYDAGTGRTVIGTGYNARVVIDQRGTQTAPQDPAEPVDNPPVDNPASGSCAPPSLTPALYEGQMKMVGGFTTTAARSQKTSPTIPTQPEKRSSKKRTTILGAAVTAAGMRLGDKLARAIRERAPWTRKATHDQLRWVCSDMGEQQWTEEQAVRFVVNAGHQHAAGYGWDPDRPHRLIAAALRTAHDSEQQEQQLQADLTLAVSWQDSTAGRAAADLASLTALFATADPEPEPERTNLDRYAARLDWNIWPEVAAHYRIDPNDALDLYGTELCVYAEGQDARHNQPTYA